MKRDGQRLIGFGGGLARLLPAIAYLVLPGSFLCAAAFAQTTANASESGQKPASAGAGTSSPDLEEIVVTAGKRRELLSQVGSAVSAISGEQLQEIGANSMQDYLSRIPGLSLQSGGTPGYGEVSIRGIAPQSVGATTATYIDEVPFGPTSALTENALFTLDLNPTDLDRVEVLKGPQGTLYGASSMGGLIKYVTRAPDLTKTEFRASEDFNQSENGSLGVNVGGAVSAPLIADMLAVRLNAYYQHEGGFITDVGIGGEDTNRSNNKGFHGSLLFKPLDDLSIRLNAILQYTSVHGLDAVDIDQATGRPPYGNLTQLRYAPEPFSNEVRLFSGEVNYDLGKIHLLSATSYSSLKPYSGGDVTAVYQAIGLPLASPQTPISGDATFPSQKVTEELRLTSERMGIAEWMVGGFFQHESVVDGVQTTQYLMPGFVPNANIQSSFREGTLTEYAEFANVTVYLAPSVDVTAGVRHSNISQTSYRGLDGLLGNPADPTVFNTSYQAFSEDSNTYLAAARWRVTDDVLLYARAASGYRPGGGRTVPAGAPPGYKDYYTADSLWSYEGGVKIRKLGGRLTIDADTFWINWKNIQALEPLPGTIIVNDGNAGTAVSRGAEFDVAYVPVKGLTIGANGAYTDAKFTQSIPLVQVSNGEPLFYIPKYTATVYSDFSRPVGKGWDGFVGGDFAYQSQRLDLNRTPLPAYSIWNVHLGVRNANYRVNFYVKNLTNKLAYLGYENGGYGAPTYDFVVNPPRTVGVTFAETF